MEQYKECKDKVKNKLVKKVQKETKKVRSHPKKVHKNNSIIGNKTGNIDSVGYALYTVN